MISIVVPVFNEQNNIAAMFNALVESCPAPYEVIWVNDGSTDQTLQEILKVSALHPFVKCINLSRNFGHQNAILAGLHAVSGDIIIVMDGDLQHPPALIPMLLEKLMEGFDIVNAQREPASHLSVQKKLTARLFYIFHNALSDVQLDENVSDFKAFNRKVLESILQINERELFLRGIFKWVGFKQTIVTFVPGKRHSGTTKYSNSKMLKLATSGLTAFSTKPLRLAFWLGMIATICAFLFIVFAVYSYTIGKTFPGWASIITCVLFMGGVQLIVIGIIGTYIGHLFNEVKRRPNYIIDSSINLGSPESPNEILRPNR
jgi:polyisoprenyl-phosphate glycosyltransferase